MTLAATRADLWDAADAEKASFLQRYFKTGPGEYAEGDIFLGLTAAELRGLARAHADLALADLATLLRSKVHEERSLALTVLVRRFTRSRDDAERERLHRFYIRHLRCVNNWDLVDGSAPDLVGGWLAGRDRALLDRLVRSRRLWDRRVAILATYPWIKAGDFADTLRLSERLLGDREDLMHKAVGWMLREVGKRDRGALERFLRAHGPRMPRTALRYAIERFDPAERARWLAATRKRATPSDGLRDGRARRGS